MSMAINSINRAPNMLSINNTQNNRPAQRLASGRRINSAADDAAGLAISEGLQALIRGLEQGTRNSGDMQSLLTTAEGGMGGITDSLQRVRELGLQAQNSILTPDNRALLQQEVDQILNHIDRTATSTQFNTRNLLDGTAQDLHTASYGDGSGMSVSIGSFTTQSLGVDGFDVTGDFDLRVIDEALSQVSGARANIGAATNRLDFTMQTTSITAENLSAANSRIADADMGRESISFNINRVLEQYRMFSLRSQMARQGNLLNLLL